MELTKKFDEMIEANGNKNVDAILNKITNQEEANTNIRSQIVVFNDTLIKIEKVLEPVRKNIVSEFELQSYSQETIHAAWKTTIQDQILASINKVKEIFQKQIDGSLETNKGLNDEFKNTFLEILHAKIQKFKEENEELKAVYEFSSVSNMQKVKKQIDESKAFLQEQFDQNAIKL